MNMIRETGALAGAVAMVMAAMLGACGGGGESPRIDLDSAGAKIERGMKKVGSEIDTALTGVRTELDEAQIRGLLRRLNGMDNVDVDLQPDGHVRLSGAVATVAEKDLAEKVTRNIRGVTGVTSGLVVDPSLDTVAADAAR